MLDPAVAESQPWLRPRLMPYVARADPCGARLLQVRGLVDVAAAGGDDGGGWVPFVRLFLYFCNFCLFVFLSFCVFCIFVFLCFCVLCVCLLVFLCFVGFCVFCLVFLCCVFCPNGITHVQIDGAPSR